MALRKCKECGTQVSTKAKTCPSCGAPVGYKVSFWSTFLLVVFVMFIIGYCSNDKLKQSVKPDISPKTSQSPKRNTQKEYTFIASKTMNIRSAPGLKFPVKGQLLKGDKVPVLERNGDWILIKKGSLLGYVYETNAEAPNVEKRGIVATENRQKYEIVSWTWRADPEFGGDGSVIWTVEVKNNTSSYVSLINVEFTSYDETGNILTSADTYVEGLGPGERGSLTAYADYFGREYKAKVRIVD